MIIKGTRNHCHETRLGRLRRLLLAVFRLRLDRFDLFRGADAPCYHPGVSEWVRGFRPRAWRPDVSTRSAAVLWGISPLASALALTFAAVLWSTIAILAIARSDHSGRAFSSRSTNARLSLRLRCRLW